MKKRGEFVNKMGYELTKLPVRTATANYRCTLKVPPLMWWDTLGQFWRTDETFVTDMGSEPFFVEWIPALQKDRYLLPYLFHDAIYRTGRLWKRWHSSGPDGAWTEQRMSRGTADAMLRNMMENEGAWWTTRWVVWAGVRMGGWWRWGKKD